MRAERLALSDAWGGGCSLLQEEFYGKEVIVADREMVEMVSVPQFVAFVP